MRYWNQLKDEAGVLKEEYRQSPYRPDVEQALEALKTLADKGAAQAKDGLERFRKEHQTDIDNAIADLKNLRDKLLNKGDQSGARRLEKEIEKLEQPSRP